MFEILGVNLHADASIDAELNQKLGIASQDFKILNQVWQHSNISKHFKYMVFMSCIVAKLLYGLDSAWLSSAMQRKLDGFQANCLRRILKISPAFISRISNRYILSQFKACPLSSILLDKTREACADQAHCRYWKSKSLELYYLRLSPLIIKTKRSH